MELACSEHNMLLCLDTCHTCMHTDKPVNERSYSYKGSVLTRKVKPSGTTVSSTEPRGGGCGRGHCIMFTYVRAWEGLRSTINFECITGTAIYCSSVQLGLLQGVLYLLVVQWYPLDVVATF